MKMYRFYKELTDENGAVIHKVPVAFTNSLKNASQKEINKMYETVKNEMKLFEYETKKRRLDNDNLRSLCIKNNWFTCGTVEQYDKLFEMNEQGASIEAIATVIWLCSDSDVPENCRIDIIFALHEAGFAERCDISEQEHLNEWLGI